MGADLTTLALFGGFGWQEILVILLVVLVLFGGKKLPELARGLGRGMREFKDELKGTKREIDEAAEDLDDDFDDEYDEYDQAEYEEIEPKQIAGEEPDAPETHVQADQRVAEKNPEDAEQK